MAPLPAWPLQRCREATASLVVWSGRGHPEEEVHGTVQRFWLLVEDSESSKILTKLLFTLRKFQLNSRLRFTFCVPVFEPLPGHLWRCLPPTSVCRGRLSRAAPSDEDGERALHTDTDTPCTPAHTFTSIFTSIPPTWPGKA